MKLLIIAHDYPPILSPRASRWGTIISEFVRAGHEVQLICGWIPRQERREEPLPGLQIRRVGGGLLAGLRRGLGGGPQFVQSGGVQGEEAAHDSRRGRRVLKRVRRTIATAARVLWRSIYWPDAWCGFIWPAWREARRLISARRPDALITVSYPFSSHIPGLWLKRRHPDLPWLVDIGDPFALFGFPNNGRLYRRINVRAEAAVLAAADCISVTNHGAREHYVANFSIPEKRIVTIDPVLADARPVGGSATGPVSARAEPPHALRLVYCGQLYRDIRSPEPLLRLADAMIRGNQLQRPIELHFYGGIGDCADLFDARHAHLGRHVFRHGRVARAEAIQALEEADVLVNIGNATAHQVPSKIVDYMATGKPVLNLVTRGDDLSRELLAGYTAAVSIDVRAESFQQQLERVRSFLDRLPKRLEGPGHEALLKRFRPESVTAAYIASVVQCRKAA